MRILILKPSSLGDVVHALPVLRCLKRHLPKSEVFWWIGTNLAPLLEDDPDLAGVIPFDRRRWASPANWLALWRSVQWMRAQDFDWVIDLQCLLRSGAFAWLANGRLLVGLDEQREGVRGFYDLTAPGRTPLVHAVDRYLGVLPLLGVPVVRDFQWLPQRPRVAAAIRQKWAVGDAPWILLQPGARWLNKRWPAESFAELARLIAGNYPRMRIAILGGSEDRPLGEAIARSAPERCLDLTGRISLPEMVEWIRLGALMVTNDTGPMHVAAALGTPLIALFGPTEPLRTGPYGQLEHVLQLNLPCVPCLNSRCHYAQPLACLCGITPAAVFRALQARLSI